MLLLHKSMLQGEGVGKILNSRVNIWLRTEPLIEQWLLDNRNPRTMATAFLRRLSRVFVQAQENGKENGDGSGEGERSLLRGLRAVAEEIFSRVPKGAQRDDLGGSGTDDIFEEERR